MGQTTLSLSLPSPPPPLPLLPFSPSLPFPSLLTYLPTYSGIHGGGGHRSQVVVVAAAAVGRSGGGGGGDGTHRIVSADPLAFLSCMLGKDQIPESAASSSSAWNCTTVVGGGAP